MEEYSEDADFVRIAMLMNTLLNQAKCAVDDDDSSTVTSSDSSPLSIQPQIKPHFKPHIYLFKSLQQLISLQLSSLFILVTAIFSCVAILVVLLQNFIGGDIEILRKHLLKACDSILGKPKRIKRRKFKTKRF